MQYKNLEYDIKLIHLFLRIHVKKTKCVYDITEILLKVTLNTIKPYQSNLWNTIFAFWILTASVTFFERELSSILIKTVQSWSIISNIFTLHFFYIYYRLKVIQISKGSKSRLWPWIGHFDLFQGSMFDRSIMKILECPQLILV
jgi:hypothetical protein